MNENIGPTSVSVISTSPGGSSPKASRKRLALSYLSALIFSSGERTATWSRNTPTSNFKQRSSAASRHSRAVACSDSKDVERFTWSWNGTHLSGFSSAAANVRSMQAVVRPEPRIGSSTCCCRSFARCLCWSYSDHNEIDDSSSAFRGSAIRDTVIPFGSLQLTTEFSAQMPLDSRCRTRRSASRSSSNAVSTDFSTGLCPTIAASVFVAAASCLEASAFFPAFFGITNSFEN